MNPILYDSIWCCLMTMAIICGAALGGNGNPVLGYTIIAVCTVSLGHHAYRIFARNKPF